MAGSGFSQTALFRVSNRTSDGGAGIEVTVVTKTADFTTGTAIDVILVDCSAGPVTITLPSAASTSGKLHWLKKIDATANALIIDPKGSECIDGAATLSITVENDAVQIVADGNNWFII